MNNIVIVIIDDWQGMYVNGELKYQDHKIDIEDYMRILLRYLPYETIDSISFHNEYVDLDWFEQVGQLPELLQNVVVSE